jgi:nucleotide-binding universal stress UspA family protein
LRRPGGAGTLFQPKLDNGSFLRLERTRMYTTVLVPLDGSKRAEAILPHVEALARRYEASVVFLQIVEPVLPTGGLDPDYAALYLQGFLQRKREAQAYLDTLQTEFRGKGIDARLCVAGGNIVEEILNAAERQEADLIAMASHGRTGLGRVFYGSVAAGVLHRVDRPLLLVRSEDRE